MEHKRGDLEEACLKFLRDEVGARGASAREMCDFLPQVPGHPLRLDDRLPAVLERLVATGDVYKRLKRANGEEKWVYIFNADVMEPSRQAMMNITFGMVTLQTLVSGHDVGNLWSDITGHLARLDAAVREVMAVRARIHDRAALYEITEEDVDKFKELSALMAQWRVGGKVSPEVSGLAKGLLETISKLIWAVERGL